jgi:hypothetical protein
MAVSRNNFCGCLFWLKAWFALSVALAGLGYFGYEVYRRRDKRLKELYEASVVWEGFDIQRGSAGGLAKLEPPGGVYFGLSLNWGSNDNPQKLRSRFGKLPAI